KPFSVLHQSYDCHRKNFQHRHLYHHYHHHHHQDINIKIKNNNNFDNDLLVNIPKYKTSGQIESKFGLKSTYVPFWKKVLWIGFTMGIFLIPYIVLKTCFRVKVSVGAWQTSITYGMLMALDFMAVIGFSALN